jgi:uncharacterized membrane-anchored protein YitT (DUF2179 family)
MKQYINVIVGSILLSLGIWLFVTPTGINFGGLIGLAQIINYFLRMFISIPSSINTLGIINFLLNIPLFIIAFRIMHKEFCFKTVISLAIQTVLLSVLPALSQPIVEDMVLNVVFAAIICGIGVGLALSGSGCCGGMDIATVCIVKKNPDFKTGMLSIYFNIVLFSICLLWNDLATILYSVIFVGLLYTTADRFHSQNINVTYLVFTKNKQLKHMIMDTMGRGVTYWNGKGAYTDNDTEILYVAINKYEVPQLNKIIHDADPDAFVTLSQGSLIHGGFEKRL